MSTVTTLQALYVHNDWAGNLLLDLAEPLGDEALNRPFEMGLGTLRATLCHLWAAERLWLARWLGNADARLERNAGGLSVAELRGRFEETARERNELFAREGAPGARRTVSYNASDGQPWRLPLGDLMLHVANHGVHHRAQASNMLRHLGVKPPRLDYLYMRIESPDEPAVAYEADTLGEYLRYGDWARERLHALCRDLDDAALDRPVEMGVGSLRKTLLHCRDAEQWWLRNWSGPPPDRFEELSETTSIAELDALARETAGARDAFLGELSDEALEQTVTASPAPGRTFHLRLGDVLIQLGGHGTHHRAQALNMLRRLGVETPALDYWVLASQTVARA